MNNRKIYVIGSSEDYANWMEGDLVGTMEEADLVVLTGGEDVSPHLYEEKIGRHTYTSKNRDIYEITQVQNAIRLKKPLIGICRGAQLLCVLAGGSLVQHMNHPARHLVKLWDGQRIYTNSMHHQMAKLNKLQESDYRLIAYAEGLSDTHLNGTNAQHIMGRDTEGKVIEPEIVYYKQINALGIQGHPEMLGFNSELVSLGRGLLDCLIDGSILSVIDSNISSELFFKNYATATKEVLN